MLKNEPLTIQGSGEQKRSFLYVSDVCRAFDIVLRQGVIGEIYNIGCKYEYSVLDVANKLIEHYGRGEIVYIEDRPFNDQRYFISSSKMEALGWKQEVLFDDGLLETIKWYTEHPNYWED